MLNLPGQIEEPMRQVLPAANPGVLNQITTIVTLHIDELFSEYQLQQLPPTTPAATPADSMLSLHQFSFSTPVATSRESQPSMLLQSPPQSSTPMSFNTPSRIRRPSATSFFAPPTPQSEASRNTYSEPVEFQWDHDSWNNQAMNGMNMDPVFSLVGVLKNGLEQDQTPDTEGGNQTRLPDLQEG
jgi:hypothetical protein